MKLLDLFSGIGGFSLAASWAGIRTIQFVELDPYCQKVLNKNFPGVPIHGDIKTFKGEIGSADIISGGFPCQPFSCAGQRGGSEDDRALWPEMFRVIKEARPSWVLGENVAGICNMELDKVLFELESEGYATQTLIIPACGLDAPHKRDRVWVVAHTERKGLQSGESNRLSKIFRGGTHNTCETAESSENVAHTEKQSELAGLCENGQGEQRRGRSGDGCCEDFAPDTERERLAVGQGKKGQRPQPAAARGHRWSTEPSVGRVAHGIPRRVDRLKGLGNAIVPQVAYQIFKAIVESEKMNYEILHA